MKFTTASIAALAFGGSSLAQYMNQSKPFALVIQSNNKYNGQALAACHEGAAIEGLCVYGAYNASANYEMFHFNTSSDAFVANATLGETGYLTYTLMGSNFNESEPMEFYHEESTNVALPLFEPSYTGTLVAFDSKGRMNVQSYIDDTVTPPTGQATRAYYRWYVCETYYTGYTYTTLTWVMGKYKPENPSCKKVDVVRKFA